LSFLLLEVLLRLGGAIFNVRLASQNRGVSFAGNEFRILCLGESTTALGGENSYPFQLEQILATRYPDVRFEVINKGMVSKTSVDILAALEDNLRRYRPQLVIAMIGVNDPKLLLDKNSFAVRVRNFLRHSRVFHLLELLGEHLRHKFLIAKSTKNKVPIDYSEENNPDEQSDDLTKMNSKLRELEQSIQALQNQGKSDPQKAVSLRTEIKTMRFQQIMILIGRGKYHRVRNQFDQAERVLLKAKELVPDNYGVLLELARVYKAQGDCAKAVPILQEAVAGNEKVIFARVELFRCYDRMGRQAEAYGIAKNLASEDIDEAWVYPELGEWFKRHNYWEEAEQVYQRAVRKNPEDAELYRRLAEIENKLGNKSAAQEFSVKFAEERGRNDSYLPETVQNYNRIVEQVKCSGSRIIVMQYPLRNIAPLKAIFLQHPGIIFVENKQNFAAALREGKYPDYFSDSFGGDFGHCTRAGNRLIAEHLADIITRDIFAKN